jgi:hypothetical protein
MDWKALGDSSVEGFDARVACLPDNLCAPFHQEARQLDAELLTIYRMIALAVRTEENLQTIAGVWGSMVALCDNAAKSLNALAKKHPDCGADWYYDRVLDLRNKCNRLQQMHS